MYSNIVLSLALALTSSSVGVADFLVLDVMPGDATCAQENIEASVMVQTDHCLKLPGGIPFFNSYMLSSCTVGADDTLAVTLDIFNSEDCTAGSGPGSGQSYTFDSLPASCFNGTQLSCQTSDPYAVTENWPAFGLYVDDAVCSLPSLMVAVAPNCNTYSYANHTYSLDVTCADATGASLSLYGTDPTIPYEGDCSGTPSEQRSMVADQCTSMATMEPIPIPDMGNILDGSLKDLFALLQLDSSDLYYYADCQGGENIPGIETNADSESGGGSGDDIGAGMLALYLTVAVVGAMLLAGGGFIYMRRQADGGARDSIASSTGSKSNTMKEDLLRQKNDV